MLSPLCVEHGDRYLSRMTSNIVIKSIYTLPCYPKILLLNFCLLVGMRFLVRFLWVINDKVFTISRATYLTTI